jgi:hypothetical protein
MVKSKLPHLRIIQGGRQDGDAAVVDALLKARIETLKRRRPDLAELDLANADTLAPDAVRMLFAQVPGVPKAVQWPAALVEGERSAALALLRERIARLQRQRPEQAIDPARLDILPRELRDTLLAPPLVQTEDGSFLLWDDPSA